MHALAVVAMATAVRSAIPTLNHLHPCFLQNLQDARFTLTGIAKPLPEADRAAAREAYLTKYPNAFYVDFGDFRWFRVEDLKGGRYVGGFGRVASVSICAVCTSQHHSTFYVDKTLTSDDEKMIVPQEV